jgi:hypothetical protein
MYKAVSLRKFQNKRPPGKSISARIKTCMMLFQSLIKFTGHASIIRAICALQDVHIVYMIPLHNRKIRVLS